MSTVLVLPLLIPLLTAAGLLVLWRARRAQRALSVVGAASLLGAGALLLRAVLRGGIQVVQVGSWPAPFGITLVADVFSAIMVVLAGLVGSMVTIYSLAGTDARRESFGYHPLQHFLLLGVCGAFVAGDLFNLYVWFEVMLMASFALLALGGERAQLEGSIKYFTLSLMSSALFLAALGILYGLIGTLNMADAARELRAAAPGRATTVAALLFVAFGIKAAVFPLFFWLPASYHTPPVAVSALFAGLLTKVAVYALIRVFTLLFVVDAGATQVLLLIVGGATMVTGVLGAAAQNEIRRILSFHIISQIGYMVMGLGLHTRLSLAGVICFIAHNILVKTNLFLVSGVVERRRGTDRLAALGGLYRTSPGLSALFLIPALSLAGLPPLSGFWAKLILTRAGLEVEQYAIVAVALVTSLLTLFSMTKIWTEVFWKEAPEGGAALEGGPARAGEGPLLVPAVVLTALTAIMGLCAEPVFAVAARAADQLLRPDDYIRAVLEGDHGRCLR
jgi:multicomponent Na+:H+ antiporter subunit D